MEARFIISPDGSAITCRDCNATSHNANDVRELYCGNCCKFHVLAPPSESFMQAISASAIACYCWPEDTESDRAARADFVARAMGVR